MTVVILMALLFSPLAGAMAFGITYVEYAKHFVDRREVLRRPWRAALAARTFRLTRNPASY
jgi:hypothetical protein